MSILVQVVAKQALYHCMSSRLSIRNIFIAVLYCVCTVYCLFCAYCGKWCFHPGFPIFPCLYLHGILVLTICPPGSRTAFMNLSIRVRLLCKPVCLTLTQFVSQSERFNRFLHILINLERKISYSLFFLLFSSFTHFCVFLSQSFSPCPNSLSLFF